MITVVLPAYNEELNIEPLLRKLRSELDRLQVPYRVLVVDDGSTDGTAAVVSGLSRELKVDLLSHPANMGLGKAILHGMEAALAGAHPEDIIVTLDADNTHDPAHIHQMYRLMMSGKELVIASRFVAGGKELGLGLFRKLLSRMARMVFRLIIPIADVTDFTCGYRAYRASLLQAGFEKYGDGFIESSGFSVMTELLMKLSAFDPKCGEVPLVLKYHQKQGKSKLKVLRAVRHYGTVIFRFYKTRS